MKTKKFEIEIRDNSGLSLDEKGDRLKVVAMDLLMINSDSKMDQMEKFEKSLSLMAEAVDLLREKEKIEE